MYLCGHSHLLEHFIIDGKPTPYIISGAGSMVNVTMDVKPKGKSAPGHTYQNIFSQKVAGFTSHTFSADLQSLTTDLISYNGTAVYSLVIKKHSAY
jgi:hypothetical protein